MSRLRELRLHGFKTFADPTRFVFERGVTAVIGPNGSGKSNMADAVRWVLGEQSNRSLRTRRADDVIFAGSQQRKPQGMAEAVLTLDNGDGWLPIEFGEVTIGRRAYRSGDSDYLINGARARLRDVVELLGEGRLGANELVVVGQGTVDAALSLRPEERRQLFEEAAGVKNLQVRKNEALARLGKAQENLGRLSDLITELRPQVRRLAQQAQHQQEHDTLRRRAFALVNESHRRRESEARARLGEARRRAAAAEAALEAFRAEQAAGQAAIAAAEQRYWEAEAAARVAAERREATREAAIRAEGRLEAVRRREAELTNAIRSAEEELAAARGQLAELAPGTGDPALDEAARQANETEERWRAASAALAERDRELLQAEEALATVRQQRAGLLAERARRAEEGAAATARRARVEREDAAARTAHAAAAAALVPLRAALEEATVEARDRREALAGALREAETAQQEHDAARRAARELRERSELVRAQLGALKEHAEATNRLATRLVDRGWRPLLDALRAPEEAWAAIEAVIGGELADALLWRGDDPTPDLDEARGSARLLQLEGGTAAGRDAALTAVGGERTLAEWVGEDAPAILGRAVVARDPAALLAGWSRLPAGWLAVTLEGDLADARGVLVLRGRGDAPGGGAAREHQRRRELEEALERIVVDEREGDAMLSSAERRMREATASREAAQRARDEAERRVREAAAGVEGAESRLARAEREATRLAAELATAQHREAETRDELASPAAAADQLETDELNRRAEAVRAARSGAVAERDAARQEWQAARSRVETLEAALTGARRRRGELELRIAQIEGSLPSQRSTLAATVDELDAARGEAERTRTEDDAAASARGAADAERERLRAELLELERGSRLGARLAELERNAQASAIEASRHDEALAALLRERELAIAGFVEEGEGEPGGALADPAAGEEAQRLDDAELETELRRVRRTLGQIGSVNPFAVQEHGELAARLEELETQDRDLRNASGSIQELIDRLGGEIVERFNTAFASIAERFDEFCRLLFAGGSASLQQVEGDQDAPGGIEITVRPPGKRPQRLAMLSGGERALTGVALLFAMLSVNPVPFCVLDEVDAALDEANIGRFADALRRLSETIDFVVITHNRATMEVADTIYGVTMTDAAVSRVLSLRLADIAVEVSA